VSASWQSEARVQQWKIFDKDKGEANRHSAYALRDFDKLSNVCVPNVAQRDSL